MNTKITWRFLQRDEVPNLLEHGPASLRIDKIDNRFPHTIKAGFIESSTVEPILLVVTESDQADFFSWITTFSPDTFPITQTVRVIGNLELQLINETLNKGITPQFDRRWANIILGEMLAQGEVEQKVSSVPLSRYLGCFSTALAKSGAIYGSSEANSLCIRRLLALELDKRFVARNITISDLNCCWTFFEKNKSKNLTVDFISKQFMRELSKIHNSDSSTQIKISDELFPGLLSDSIEKRVITFNTISDTLYKNTLSSTSLNGALLAAAAFLVGRGTSHINLLKKTVKELPNSLIWFGVLSALTDFKNHDTQWKRTARSIERLISQSFDLREKMHSDIGWAEYSWIYNYANNNYILDIPKLYPRTLSIEVLPGASCQLRLASSTPQKIIDAPSQVNDKFKEVERGIEDLINLAIKVRESMMSDTQKTEPIQGSLLPVMVSEKKPKPARMSKPRTSSKTKKV